MYIHDKKDKSNLINSYFIALIPMLLYGIYKNGIHLYINELIPFGKIFIPIYFYLISVIVGIIISLIRKEKKKENILICLIISCIISINTNMLIYPIFLFITVFIGKYILDKMKINIISFSKVLFILCLLLSSYSYLNIGEKLNKFNFSLFDIFMGHGIGGIASTSAIILIFSLIILLLNRYYKRIIPVIAIISFIVISLIYILIFKNYDYLNNILNGNVYFSFIFVAPDLYNTPSNYYGMTIYGILIGLFTFIFSLIFNIYEAPYISILLFSIFIPLINKITNRRFLKLVNQT